MTNRIDKFQDENGKHLFLSNFYPSPLIWDGVEWPTVEHAYQAGKSLDQSQRTRIRFCSTPGQAKREGRKLELRYDWEDVKLAIMDECLRAKFEDPKLAEMLVATGDATLVEGNHWRDFFWGVCDGKGANWLGRLLMLHRSRLNLTSQGTLL